MEQQQQTQERPAAINPVKWFEEWQREQHRAAARRARARRKLKLQGKGD